MRMEKWCQGALTVLIVCCIPQIRTMRPPLPSDNIFTTTARPEPCKHEKNSSNMNILDNVKEFFIEHQITDLKAKNAAKEMSTEKNYEDGIGCEECTEEEMRYCMGPGVIDDHCCCDRRFIESFPFMPHTCYRGLIACTPVRPDCEDYVRVRDCCCKNSLLIKWKERFNNSSTNVHKNEVVRWIVICLTVLTVL